MHENTFEKSLECPFNADFTRYQGDIYRDQHLELELEMKLLVKCQYVNNYMTLRNMYS